MVTQRRAESGPGRPCTGAPYLHRNPTNSRKWPPSNLEQPQIAHFESNPQGVRVSQACGAEATCNLHTCVHIHIDCLLQQRFSLQSRNKVGPGLKAATSFRRDRENRTIYIYIYTQPAICKTHRFARDDLHRSLQWWRKRIYSLAHVHTSSVCTRCFASVAAVRPAYARSAFVL